MGKAEKTGGKGICEPDRLEAAIQAGRMKKLAEFGMSLTGEPFEVFGRIVQILAEFFEVPVVALSEIRGDKLFILSLYQRGIITTNAGEIDLGITPCATVQETKCIRFHHDIQSKFPDFAFLKQLNAYSYCGFPALDSQGNVKAVTCLLDDKQHDFTEEDRDFLQIFSQRIGFEIERQKTVADRLQAEQSLQESEEKYRSLVESSEDSIYLVDREYRYLFMNRKHLVRMGFSDDGFRGKTYGDCHTPEETAEFSSKVDMVFETGEPVQFEHRSSRDGRYFLRTLSPVKDHVGKTFAVTVVSKNISELKQMEEQLRSLSLMDELTGIYNRRGFFTLAEQQLKIASRQQKGIFILFADLDDLKGINDTFGHQEGDNALIECAGVLRNNFRYSDIIARVGGDEFIVLPAGTTEVTDTDILDRLQKDIDRVNRKKGRKYLLSLSAGVAYYDPENPRSIEELIAQGDALMYEQKKKKHRPG